jgi:cytochrome c biogenesis factor
MLPNSAGSPGLLVPHATIASLLGAAVNALGKWNGEPGALDLWVGLISGATVSVSSRHARKAAA